MKPKKLTLKDEVKKQMQNDANKSIADMMRTMGALSAILGEHDLWTDQAVQSNPIKVMFCWFNDDREIIVRLLCMPSLEEFKKDAQVATEVMVHVDSDTFGDREKLYQVMGFLTMNNINYQFCNWDDDPEDEVDQDRGSMH